MNKYNSPKSILHPKWMKMYAELIENYKKYRIKSLYGNNLAYGMFGNQYSWLFDHKVRLQICVNGQLMLAMLIEKLFKAGIELIDANTDGLYVKIYKHQKDKFHEIISWWELITSMEMEETRFEKLWFLNTADYFGTYLKKGKLEEKLKGLFITDVQLGKGMEFPIIAKAVKKYFLEGISYKETILNHEEILDFCSYKKLKYDYECFQNGETRQRVNRFFACKTGAYLYKQQYSERKEKYQVNHILKDSPVQILNKLDDIPIKDRDLNYPFYMYGAREIIYTIEKDKNPLGF